METKTMETKTGHFIDKNYLEKSFINYDTHVRHNNLYS